MGAMNARAMAEMSTIGLEQALAWHLTSNHFPPVPTSMIPACIAAIDAGNAGDWDRKIGLPDGVGYRGLTVAPAAAIIEAHHLDAWIDADDEPAEIDDAELWASIFGSGWESWSWWHGVDYRGGDWNRIPLIGMIKITHDNENSERVTTTFDTDHILKVARDVIRKQGMNPHDLDAGDGDVILQTAVFGETIFG